MLKLGMNFYWIEQWSQFLGGCNWYTFNPILIEFEDERNMGAVEFSLIVMGLGFRWRWQFRNTEFTEELGLRIDSIRDVFDQPTPPTSQESKDDA